MTTRQPWQHVFALPVDGDARSESVFMARFETVKWPRFWQYQRVLQIDADTLVNGCLAPVFARVTPAPAPTRTPRSTPRRGAGRCQRAGTRYHARRSTRARSRSWRMNSWRATCC